jgi:hypothetical protein
MSDTTHPADELDQWEFDDKAAMAVSMLRGHGHAFVDLQPGDGTTYKIVVVQPLRAVHPMRSPTGWEIVPDRYWFGSSFGHLYPMNPMGGYHWDYVRDHWLSDERSASAPWTARVLARFLNALCDRLAGDGRVPR